HLPRVLLSLPTRRSSDLRKLVSKSSAPSLCAGLRSIPFLLALAFLSYPSRVDSQTTYQEELKLANEASNSKRFEEAISHYRRVLDRKSTRLNSSHVAISY